MRLFLLIPKAYCKATGVGLIPWSPIARGALTRPLSQQKDSLRAKTDKFLHSLVHDVDHQPDRDIIDRIEQVAKKRNVSMAVIAMAWCISKGDIPIVGISKKERIDDAVTASTLELTAEEITYLEEMYQPKPIQGLVR